MIIFENWYYKGSQKWIWRHIFLKIICFRTVYNNLITFCKLNQDHGSWNLATVYMMNSSGHRLARCLGFSEVILQDTNNDQKQTILQTRKSLGLDGSSGWTAHKYHLVDKPHVSMPVMGDSGAFGTTKVQPKDYRWSACYPLSPWQIPSLEIRRHGKCISSTRITGAAQAKDPSTAENAKCLPFFWQHERLSPLEMRPSLWNIYNVCSCVELPAHAQTT